MDFAGVPRRPPRRGDRSVRADLEGTMTDNDKDALRAVKLRLLTLVATKAPPSSPSPFEQFMTEWQTTAERVHAEFTRNCVQPSCETMQAATWLAFQLNEPWITILGRISKAEAERFLQKIVQGRCIARFDDYARVVIRNAPRAGRGF